MTTQQYLDYIERTSIELAQKLYPNNNHLQLVYQVGFLRAQLAQAMNRDSLVASHYRHQINRAL